MQACTFILPEIEQFRKWLHRKSPHASTPIHYANDVKLIFAWLARPPEQVTCKDVDGFIEHSLALGHAVATVNRRLAALRIFFEFLSFDREEALPNPVQTRRHFIRRGTRLPRDLQDAQVARLFTVIHDPRDRAMFLLMLRCGMRVSEVQKLSMEDLYLQPAAGRLPRLWLHGKGDKERVVYLASQPLAALRAWLKLRPQGDEQAVFLNRFGRRLTVTGIQDRLAGYCRKAGMWITCHQLRHTFGRHLTEARVPLTSIQCLLGHRWLSSTQTYLYASNPVVQADYDAAMQLVMQKLALEDIPGEA